MTGDSVEQHLAGLLTQILKVNVKTTDNDARLREDYGADSMDLVEIADRLEIAFEITVQTDDIPSILTFGDTVEYVKRRGLKK